MKVLIAGKGFLGEAVGERLEEENEVSYLSRSDADFEQDITEEFELDEEFDVLIHTVGLAPGFYSAEQYRKVHAEGTRNLIDAVEAEKVIYISALGAGQNSHSYFKTKEQAEETVKESAEEFTVLRPATIYGEGNQLLEMIRKMAFTRIFPNLKTEMQPIRLEDMVEIVGGTLDSYDGEVLNVAGPEKMTMGQMGRGIYREEGYSCLLIPFADFKAKIALTVFGFLPPPLNRENLEILDKNLDFQNDAEDIVELGGIFT